MGRKQYERLVSRSRGFSEAWQQFTAAVDLERLQIDPDEIFTGVRDEEPGRNADL